MVVFLLARLEEERVMSSTYPTDDDPLARVEERQMMYLVGIILDEPNWHYCIRVYYRWYVDDAMMMDCYSIASNCRAEVDVR